MSNIFEQTFIKHRNLVIENSITSRPGAKEIVDALNKVEGVEAKLDYQGHPFVKHDGRAIIVFAGDSFSRGGTDDGYTSGTKLSVPGAKYMVCDADKIVKLRASMEAAGFKVSEVKVGHYESGGYSRSGTQPRGRGSVAYFGILELPPTT